MIGVSCCNHMDIEIKRSKYSNIIAECRNCGTSGVGINKEHAHIELKNAIVKNLSNVNQ